MAEEQKFTTTFKQDFTTADAFGISGVQDTFNRAFNEWNIGSIEPKGGQLSQWFYVRYNEDVEYPSKTTITINIEDKPEFVKTLKESYKKC